MRGLFRHAASVICAAIIYAALTPCAVLPSARRYARVGEFEGSPEVQVRASSTWRTAIRNLPLIESSRIRTAAQDRIELEFDEGSLLRITGEALAELSDYTQLSTGQRITFLSLDHGVAYFTGEPRPHDTLTLAAPGAQITLRRGSRIRLEASEQSSAVAVMEGTVRLTTSAFEMELHTGQFARLDPANPAHFTLLRELPKLESDAWSDARDRATASTTSATYISGVDYGLNDIDHAGAWIQTPSSGAVWKPRSEANWRPFRDGRWEWYDEAGYTWIPNEAWGWLPYHYGRWIQDSSLGWVWSPDRRPVPLYKPGDVYWLRGTNRIAWGPLAPGEIWTGASRSQLFAPANTTLAQFNPGQREIDPASFDPKVLEKTAEALAAMSFTVAPLSPAFPGDRFEAVRPEFTTVQHAPAVISSLEPPFKSEAPADLGQQPVPSDTPAATEPAQAADQTPPDYTTAPEVPETYYPVPTETGIIVIDPPYRIGTHPEHRQPPPAPRSPTPAPPAPAPPKPVVSVRPPEPTLPTPVNGNDRNPPPEKKLVPPK